MLITQIFYKDFYNLTRERKKKWARQYMHPQTLQNRLVPGCFLTEDTAKTCQTDMSDTQLRR